MSTEDVRTFLNGAADPNELTVNIQALIEFFDVNTAAKQDASSIKAILGEEFAVACMKRYFESQDAKAELLSEKGASDRRLPCTTGGKKGFQLDGWFVVEKDGVKSCYQTEIKSWSFHGIGGGDQRLLITGQDDAHTLAQKRYIFSRYYDANTKQLLHPGTRKVLLRMKQPQLAQRKSPYPTRNPMALLCLWAPVCKADSVVSEIFFPVPISSLEPLQKENGAICEFGGFDQVHIFSVSNYLRGALAKSAPTTGPLTISLSLPRIAERIRLLSAIFA